MNPEEQVDLIRFMLREWKNTYRELLVFQGSLRIILGENPQMEAAVDNLLGAARKSEGVQKRLDDQFSRLEEIVISVGEGTREKLGRELLEKWNPNGEPN